MNHVLSVDAVDAVESIGTLAPRNSRQPILTAAEAAYAVTAG
jgi:hypothetical protein